MPRLSCFGFFLIWAFHWGEGRRGRWLDQLNLLRFHQAGTSQTSLLFGWNSHSWHRPGRSSNRLRALTKVCSKMCQHKKKNWNHCDMNPVQWVKTQGGTGCSQFHLQPLFKICQLVIGTERIKGRWWLRTVLKCWNATENQYPKHQSYKCFPHIVSYLQKYTNPQALLPRFIGRGPTLCSCRHCRSRLHRDPRLLKRSSQPPVPRAGEGRNPKNPQNPKNKNNAK